MYMPSTKQLGYLPPDQQQEITARLNIDMRTKFNQKTSLQRRNFVILYRILLTLGIITFLLQETYQQQQDPCPKVCRCDDQALETVCHGSILASRIPLTLNPGTKKIVMNHAQITVLSNVDSLTNLEVLDLTDNRISSIDFAHINSNVNLISLNVSYNTISEIKDSKLLSMSKLDPASISAALEDPEKVKALRKAKINVLELILSHNSISVLRNYTFLRWTRLQRLDLSYNALMAFESDSLFGLSKLKQLDLRGNQLIQVPGQALLGAARSLSLISTSSSEQPTSKLRSLDLGANALVSLDANSFTALEQLQELFLDSCSLQSIDKQTFNGLTSLYLLSLNQNNLTEVPTDSFAHLGSIKQLFLDSNQIQRIHPHAFRNLFNLEDLQINNSSLQELEPQALTGLTSLKRLSLSYNSNLTKVYENLIDDMPKLVHLDFHKCSLSSLPTENNLDEHPLTILDLRDNPLRCTCQMKWLTKWLSRLNETVIINIGLTRLPPQLDSVIFHNYVKNQLTSFVKFANDMINVTCTWPPALAGKPVIQLPDNKLECIRPTSTFNLHVGFASLLLLVLAFITVCMVNFCRDDRHLIGIIKANLAQNRISTMLTYSRDLHNNVNNFKKETQMECVDYEPVDYSQTDGPIYTVPPDQSILQNSGSQHQTHRM